MLRSVYWDSKNTFLDKSTYDLINELLLSVFEKEDEELVFPMTQNSMFLYLEQTGKMDWLWRDPVLHDAEDDQLYYTGELPVPDNRKIPNLGEISIHESYIEEEDGEKSTYYQMYIWCWNNLDDLGACVVLDGFVELDIKDLGNKIVEDFGFVEGF